MPSSLLLAWLTVAPISGDIAVHSPAVFCSDGQLAYLGGRPGQELWYRVALDGGEPVPLYLDPPYDHAARSWWSPDGTRLAYVATVGGELTLQVWTVGEDQAQAFSVLDESGKTGGFEPLLAWSRDGQRLAFTRRTAPEATLPYAIFVLSADGSGPLRDVQSPYPPLGLAWDWTAEKLAHAAGVDVRKVLVMTYMDPPRAITVSPNLTVLPQTLTFSPDGRRVLFGATGDLRAGVRLFVSRPDGMLPAVRMRHDGYLPDLPPAWSPDGKWLAFCTGSLSRPERGRLQLASADKLERAVPAARDCSWLAGPVFSPDSAWLAATSYRGVRGPESEVVWVSMADPSRSIALDAPPNAAQPVFAPDGQRIAVTADHRGRRGLFLLPVPRLPE